ncbi:g11008 [Coccomyxa elongata]
MGHRAELWDVENPLQEVTSSVVTCGDDCWIRLHAVVSGDLFAECPIMKGKPLTSSVEPVVDSSRYFVLRVVDRDSGRHAFIGFGFRQRAHATDFTAALSDYQQYLRRSEEALAMQQAFAAAESGKQGPNLPNLDFSLKPGETVSLKLSAKVPSTRGSFLTERLAAMPAAEAHTSDDGAGALLPPPPALQTAQEAATRAVSEPLLPHPPSDAGQAQQTASIGGTVRADDSRKEDGNEAGSSAIDDCSDKLVVESSVDEEFGNFVG